MSCVQELLFETFSNLCGMEVYNVEYSYVCTEVTVRTSNWSSDDNRHVKFFSTYMLFTPSRLVLVAQYLISKSLMVDSNFARRHDKSLVVHVLGPAIKRCLKGVLCSFGVPYRYRRFFPPQTFSNPQSMEYMLSWCCC